ncbi:MAG: sulfatase-like hydrolase/transferase [Christensenella sp.]|uniref:LTA synthase family protein n=1 Tax=Christensenella sp. TaxID=1935934 RepID=UPI002B1F2EE4|nr:sulfatase-like hydrolase/transferase [Christensenella sp.]MEA5003483.1 sulfatase-like hydrolase/transferase [Christensenella sp.]
MKNKFFEKDQLKLFLWFFCSVFYFESMVRILQGVPYFGAGLLFIALFGASLAALLTAICMLLPPKGGKILSIVFLALMYALYVIQMFYYFMFSTYLTVFSIINGMEALGFGGNIWATLSVKWPFVLLMFVPFVLYVIFARKLWRTRNIRGALLLLVAAIALHFGGRVMLPAFGTGYFSPYEYYTSNSSLNQSVQHLGIFTTFRLNAQRHFFGEPEVQGTAPSAPPKETPPLVYPEDKLESTTDVPAAAEETKPKEYTEQVLNIDFDALIQNAPDEQTRAMHEYFANVQPTRENEYTGKFEGYNLITITAEAFAPYAIDEELTPTLYKMYNEGFQFTNFYCPEWEVSTSDGEYVNCLGLVPKRGVWSMYLSGKWENELPFALGNQFSALGYNTFAYHNNTYDYYNRDLSHPNMGYTYKGLGNGLEVTQTWPESDLEMIDLSTKDYLTGQPFHAYYMTVSGHMAYNFDGNEMSKKNRELVKNVPISEGAKAYLACNIELDRALQLLLERLEEADVADKTVIALSPDHPPYGLAPEEISEFLGHPVDMDFEYAKNTFLLYTPNMEPTKVDKVCCSLDILPTLSNLFGLPYDSRLLMGRDIFSDAEPLAIFGNRSFVTDKVSFDSDSGEVVPVDGQAIEEGYIESIQQIVGDKFQWSQMMLDTDYYSLVFGEGI